MTAYCIQALQQRLWQVALGTSNAVLQAVFRIDAWQQRLYGKPHRDRARTWGRNLHFFLPPEWPGENRHQPPPGGRPRDERARRGTATATALIGTVRERRLFNPA